MVSPMQKKAAVAMIVCMGLCSRTRACRVLGLSRSSHYYRGRVDGEKLAQEGLVEEVSRQWPCLGYMKVTAILKHEHGQRINHKRVMRIRRGSGLMASRGGVKRRRLEAGERLFYRAEKPDKVWSYDFVQDGTADGSSARMLTLMDEYTRECFAIRCRRSFPAKRVIDVLDEVMLCTGRKPEFIRSDNGPEFIAKEVKQWLGEIGIGPRYIEPGAPWENGCIESFHAQLRRELLDRELFFDLQEMQAAVDEWQYLYNFKRPHGSLGNLPPAIAAQRGPAFRPFDFVEAASTPVHAGQTPQLN